MGWDDNGLPTERRVQNYYGVRCDPSLPYDPDFTPPRGAAARAEAADQCRSAGATSSSCASGSPPRTRRPSRSCGARSACRSTGRSPTPRSTTTAQPPRSAPSCATSRRGEAYLAEAPTLWDATFRTAVAQAELEDRERPGAYHRVAFHRADGGDDRASRPPGPSCSPPASPSSPTPTTSATARCSAPTVTTPVFGVEVPVSPTSWPSPTRARASP